MVRCVASFSHASLHSTYVKSETLDFSGFDLLVAFFSDVSQKCHAIIFRNMNARIDNDNKPKVFFQGY